MLLICIGLLVWLGLLVAALGVCGLAAEADARDRRPDPRRRGPRGPSPAARAPQLATERPTVQRAAPARRPPT